MSEISVNSQLVVNSNNEINLFQLLNNGQLKYNLYDNSYNLIKELILHKENVLRYSVSIDKKDIIHLIALMNTNELVYSIHKENTWSHATISKFDIQSNLYRNIDLNIFKNSINILYCSANLINSNLWTIQHVLGHKKNWTKYNIISFLYNRNLPSFYFDTDSFGNIHLLYNSIEKNNLQIYHIFYNSFVQKWSQVPQKVSLSDTNKIYPYLFIDTKDNLHGLWLESKNNNNVLKYYRLSPKKHEKYTWKQIKIPYISNCKNTPIMFEEKNILKIVYLQDNNICYLYSQNYGDTWCKGDNIKIKSNPIYLIKISNNSQKYNHIKVNHLYCSINNQLTFYFIKSTNKVYSNDHKIGTIKYNNKSTTIEQNNIKNLESKIDQLLLNQEKAKEDLQYIIDTQNKMKKKILTILDEKKDSFFDKLFNPSKH